MNERAARWKRILLWLALGPAAVLLVWRGGSDFARVRTIRYDEFKELLARGAVQEVLLEQHLPRKVNAPRR